MIPLGPVSPPASSWPQKAPTAAPGRVRRRLVTVAAVAASLFLTMMTAGLAGAAGTPVWNVSLGFILNVAAAVALVWRHQHPIRVLAAAVAGPLFFATDATAALIALYAVASVVRDRRLLVATGAVWAACVVSLLYDSSRRRDYSALTIGVRVPEDGPVPEWDLPIWVAFLVASVLVALVVAVAVQRRTSSQLSVVATALDDQTRESEVMRAEMAVAADRARIARDMHDTLAATLSRISLTAGGLQVNSTESPERVANSASLIQKTAHDGLDELKRIIGVLRGGGDAGSASGAQNLDGVSDLVASARSAGVYVTSFVDVPPQPVGPLSGHVAYRVVREALTNASRHAVGSPVGLSVQGSPDDGLRVEIRTRTGIPVPSTDGTGTGLRGIAEAVTGAGGSFGADRIGDEFVVNAWLPWYS
ncbi:histidine kinase [uncultured Williamsia sp.]|uniref:sensor histidine kinase n=1 Tax=uncultured Williamsia sp. TaxID=259311 RepID=UPI00260E4DA3|nr:histidine kinase [uncultured Williamsia sp.]